MVQYCIVPTCRNTSKDIKMHLLPKDPELFRQWIQIIQREDIPISKRKNYRICAIHFSEEMMFVAHHNRTNLIASAVPNLNIPAPTKELPEENQEIVEPQGLGSSTSIATCRALPTSSTILSTPSKCKDIKQRLNLLSHGNCSRAVQLTPKARKFYRIAKNMVSLARKIGRKNFSVRKQLFEIKKRVESGDFMIDKVNYTTLNFLQSQIAMQSKKSRGRRFSMEDKIFSLSLLKQSPRAYRLLQKTFALPSRKTLMKVLSQVPFEIGLNPHILDALKMSVSKMEPEDRICSIIFDEMSLEPALSYNKKTDSINGFEDCGEDKKQKFADHAMIFMARGLRKKWKQPIAYFFAEHGMSSPDIVRNLKEIISSLQNIGLKVVATICDQHSTNSRAIKMLKDETERIGIENRLQGFSINCEEIVPLYDVPHLLKGIRNNLLDNSASFTWKNGVQKAMWGDVIRLYELDVGDFDTKMCYKLTDAHIYKQKIKKMEVKHASQVFSQRVSSTIRGLVSYGNNCLPESSIGTADFLLFFDKLFDSMNGSTFKPEHGKLLRCAVSRSSAHFPFWYEAIKVLKTVKFLKQGGKEYVPPSIKNWISTIQGFIYIWKKLDKKKFEFLCPRNLNQDPVENFFGCIRSHGFRNINPTCEAFINSFKSLLINNFVSSHSPGANCEEDMHEGALNNLKCFLYPSTAFSDKNEETVAVPSEITETFVFEENNFIQIQTHSYIAGYMAKSIFKSIGVCKSCRNDLVSDVTEVHHQLIGSRAYGPKALLRPHTNFTKVFSNCNQVLHHYLPIICHEKDLQVKLNEKINKYVSFNFSCKKHNIKNIFIQKFVHFYIYCWIKNVNKILKGEDNRNINDNIKKLALIKYEKQKKKKEAIKNIKNTQNV